MSQQEPRKRLDEILLEKGLVSEADIRQALMSQKIRGGKFGSHLLRNRLVDEAGLVEALSAQMGCPGIVLSSLRIPEDVVKRIPKEVTLARRVMPFQYDQEQTKLLVACEDPTDESLARELSFITSGAQIELRVAAQFALDAAIERYYLGRGAPAGENHAVSVLVVTDEERAVPLVRSLLEAYDYKVVFTDSADNVIDLVEKQVFHTVLLKNSLSGDKVDLVEKVRRISPSTVVRYYKNVSSLVLDDSPGGEGDLLLRNLDLLTTLLASKAQQPAGNSARMARYVDRLCRKMNLPDRDRLVITNAAYLSDLAACYYGPDKIKDPHQATELTIKFLESLDYPLPVLQVLRSMHADLAEADSLHLPIGSLGGNILTAVDVICNALPDGEHVSLDRLDTLRTSLRDMVGKTLLTEVVDSLLEMLQEVAFERRSPQRSPQLMVYCEGGANQQTIEQKLKSEGFRTIAPTSTSSLSDLCQRSQPDLLILGGVGSPARVLAFIDQVKDAGIDFEQTPTLLVVAPQGISSLTSLFNRGVQDVVLLDQSLDLLAARVHQMTARIAAEAADAGADGATPTTQGRLLDMNLLDLLQALGPGRKTAKITIRPLGAKPGCLTLYLEDGMIVFAETEDRTGAEAVLEALCWVDGTWSVESTAPTEIPDHNNSRPNEAILMEWCRLQDETLAGSGHR
jgi:CheY-like chemotaxis protein